LVWFNFVTLLFVGLIWSPYYCGWFNLVSQLFKSVQFEIWSSVTLELTSGTCQDLVCYFFGLVQFCHLIICWFNLVFLLLWLVQFSLSII